MSLTDDFAAAQVRVKQLRRPPATDELLDLYGLYKQATLGDVTGKRPEPLDFKARAKHDAWATRKAMSGDDAKRAYVDLVAKVIAKYG